MQRFDDVDGIGDEMTVFIRHESICIMHILMTLFVDGVRLTPNVGLMCANIFRA